MKNKFLSLALDELKFVGSARQVFDDLLAGGMTHSDAARQTGLPEHSVVEIANKLACKAAELKHADAINFGDDIYPINQHDAGGEA